MTKEVVLEAKNISKIYKFKRSRKNFFTKKNQLPDDSFFALKNVSFSISKGETLGIIGKNGSGKSTLLKILSGITSPTEGEISYKGRLASILDIGSGFHPELSGRENIRLYGTLLGLSEQEINNREEEIIGFSEIGNYINEPVKNYSSGMYLRLAFSVAFFSDVDIMVLDEVISVGDNAFMIKCYERIQQIKALGTTLIIVSHSASDIYKVCSSCIWLENGRIQKHGSTDETIAAYLLSSFEVFKTTSTNFNILNSTEFPDTPWEKGERIRIRKVAIYHEEEGISEKSLFYEKPLTVDIVYNQKDIEGYTDAVIVILNQHTLPVFMSTSVLNTHRKIMDGNGTVRTSCCIPAMLLNVGYYKLSVRIMKNEKQDILFVQDVLSFQIKSMSPVITSKLLTTSMSICANLDWKTELIDPL